VASAVGVTRRKIDFFMAEPLSTEEVRKVARLSRLALSEEQIEAQRTALSAVLASMDRLRELDLTGVEPMATPLDAGAPLRDDEPGPTLPTRALMEMAPEAMEPFVKVPKVIGDGGA